jgi:hypothetical protein
MTFSRDPKDFEDGFLEKLSPSQRAAWEAGIPFATDDEYTDEVTTLVFTPKPQKK